MNRRRVVGLLWTVPLLLVASASCVLAGPGRWRQAGWDEWERPWRYGFGVGVYLPSDADVQDVFGEVWLAVAAAYAMPSQPGLRHVFDFGLAFGGRRLEVGPLDSAYGTGIYERYAHFLLIPLTYTLIRTPGGDGVGFYFGGGPGIYFGRSEKETLYKTWSGEIEESDWWWSTKFGLHAVCGYAFTPSFAVEMRLNKMLGKHTMIVDEGVRHVRRVDGMLFSLNGRF